MRFHFAKWACDQLTEDADFGKKKIIFSDEAHFDLGGYVNKPNCSSSTHTLKSRRTQNESLFGPDIIEPFVFEIEQGAAVTVNGDRYRAMLN